MIRDHHLQPGDKLPSERELSKTFGLNHRTIRKGLALLEEENTITRRVGAGTFVHNLPEQGPPKIFADRTKTMVGVICPSRMDNFATEFLGHLHRQGLNHEMNLVLRVAMDFDTSAQTLARELVDQGCRALMIPWLPQPEPVADLWRLIQSCPVPVALSRPFPGLEANCSEPLEHFGRCEFAVIENICRYFQKLEYHRIAFFGPDSQIIEGLGHRVIAYSRFTSNHGFDNHIGLVGTGPEQVDRLVEKWSPFAGDIAVICFDDDHAIRLMTALHKHGLKIPDDIAVFGYNDIPLCENADPRLSTVQFGYESFADILLDHIQYMLGGQKPSLEKKATHPLVIRDSCGGKKRAGEKLSGIIQDLQGDGASPHPDCLFVIS